MSEITLCILRVVSGRQTNFVRLFQGIFSIWHDAGITSGSCVRLFELNPSPLLL